ncbi:MAG: MoaD/ThiS family protein [Peptococcaceae bacterium]|nr:MoaD/ThiS family protein [Peptococcaceae bacterium]
MIRITVKYYSVFCVAAGFCREEELEMDGGCTLWGVINMLAGKHGENFRQKLIDKTGNLPVTAWVMVNGRRVDTAQFDQVLKSGDVVIFTTPLLVGG